MKNKFRIVKDSIVIELNPKIYPLQTVYAAAYILSDSVYFLLDGNPEKNIIVKLTPKKPTALGTLAKEFLNKLLDCSNYSKFAERSRIMRQTIIQRALLTNDSRYGNSSDFRSDDPEGIAIPWEEKFGIKNKK